MKPEQPNPPLEVARRIDEICCEFESSWQNANPVPMDELLALVEEKYQSELLPELLLLEFHYRQLAHPLTDINDYCRRFPTYKELVEQVWRRYWGQSDEVSADPAKDPAKSVSPQTIQAQYAKRTLHRQGGVGRVWIAYDRNLDRQVALKELQPQFMQNPQVRERFIREAHIPNIVPVYQMRQGSDLAEPFYTMRLVEGKTLRELTTDYHGAKKEGASRRRELVNLLNILATVCQTIAYAHSRGIIHRDLKPDNVVVGNYGEIFVLDWGLAKSIQDSNTTGEKKEKVPAAESLDTKTLDNTVIGSQIGTPAYMAPEQAAGAVDRIGKATDVYGLGTILFEILTGQPPHQAGQAEQLVRQIQHNPSPAPRELCRTVPVALNVICGKAMAKEPANRHSSPLELRDDIQSWIVDEPVSCYREPWWDRCGRWVRGHRRLINTAALLMLIATIGLTLGNHFLNQAREQVQQEKDTADQALIAAELARDTQIKTKEQAERDYRKARAMIESLSQSINSGQAEILNDFKPLQRQLNQSILTFYKYHLARHGNDPQLRAETADTYFRLGILAKSLDTLDAAQRHQERAHQLFKQLCREHPERKSYKQKLCACHGQLALLMQATGNLAAAEEHYLAAVNLAKPLASDSNADQDDVNRLRIVINNLGNLFILRGEFNDAGAFFRQILSSQDPAPRTALAAHLNLGIIYRHQGDFSSFSRSQIEASKILGDLKNSSNKNSSNKNSSNDSQHYREDQVRWYTNQVNLEITLNRWQAAVETAAKGIQAAEALASKYPHERQYRLFLASLKFNATHSLVKCQRTPEAYRHAEEAVSILQQLHQADPHNTYYEIALAKSLDNLASILWKLNRRKEAFTTIQRTITLKRRIASRTPQDHYQHLLWGSRMRYARFLLTANKWDLALQEYRQLFPLAQQLAERNPKQLSMQTALAVTLQKLALAEMNKKQWKPAEVHFSEAQQLYERLLLQNSHQFPLLLRLFEVEYNLGNLYLKQSQHENALQQYHRAQQALLKLPENRSRQKDARKKLLDCKWALAETCHALKQYRASVQHWNQAIEFSTETELTNFLIRQRDKTAGMLSAQQ